MCRYVSTYGLPEPEKYVSLGEGGTPLVQDQIEGKPVYLKLEYANPTGSYKDRGSSVLVSHLIQRGVSQAVEDSSGNAGASFAAYAAKAGIKAKIFAPDSASGPKLNQIEMFGAELAKIPGPRSAAAEAVLIEAAKGITYASHAYMPFGLLGIATTAYEIWEELGDAPGSIVCPVGHGGALWGMMIGFQALHMAGLIREEPYYLAAEAKNCAPLLTGADAASKGQPTVAEGVRVTNPSRGSSIIEHLSSGHGKIVAVPEDSILPAYQSMASQGWYVEPTSALAWCAVQMEKKNLPDPVVVILTGSGLK
ncbi:MAG TPA: pyridoxal-phosphate dependent enzyme, partial [Longilinea sp.]|nr:pyridoxal-phosphate dependent enzyme [Longilinea sp.]